MQLSSPGLGNKQILATELKGYWKVRNNIEHTIIYSTVILLLATGIYFFFSMDFTQGIIPDATRGNIAIAFLSLGIIHIIAFPLLIKKYVPANTVQGSLVHTIFLAVLISVVTFLSQQLQGKMDYTLVIIVVSSFLIPYAIHQSVLNFILIKPAEPLVWTLPPGDVVENLYSLAERNISFTIKIKERFIDNDETAFTMVSSRHLPLNLVFSQFIKENPVIRVRNPQNELYGWQFAKLSFRRKKFLNPELDLVSNGVYDKDTILIERIRL